jgi:hypothetical protein
MTSHHTKQWTRDELLIELDYRWQQYPAHLRQWPEDEQAHFAQQQGYARPQDLLAHLGAWMEESLRVIPFFQRDQRPPRDYKNDDEFNARAVVRCQAWSRAQVEDWFEQQRLALKNTIDQLPPDDFDNKRIYRWLVGTIIGHYDEHPLP